MSMGFRAESMNTSGVITVAGVDQVVINNAGDVAATTFTGALVGNAATATNLLTTTGLAPVYGVRAWAQFSGLRNTSGVIEQTNTNRLIRGSGNVSSILRNENAVYTINFSIPMPDSNYCCLTTGQSTLGVSTFVVQPVVGGNSSPGSVQIVSVNNNDAAASDIDNITVAIIR